MRITIIQVDNNIIGIENRLKQIENQLESINDTDFVVLSELSTSGYIPNENIWKYAEEGCSITKKWATLMAKKYNIYIGAGCIEKEDNDFYNTYLIANPEGVLGTIRKSEPESNIFKRGNFGHIINTPIGNIAVSICFDSHKKAFYDSIKDEDISLILMPHAWPMNETMYKEDKQKINTLLTSYGNAFDCPVIFANAIGNVEPMAGITGKLMNPSKYKLNGHSCAYTNGDIIDIDNNSNILSFECIMNSKKRKNDITFYGDWIDKGSFLYRNVALPLDIKKGIKLYNKSKEKNFKR